MNVHTTILNPEHPQKIHSSSNFPLNISKNVTRFSLDSKNQLMIKGIYKRSLKSAHRNLTIIQTNLSNNEKKCISTQTTTVCDKTLKTQETQQDERYPFKICELMNAKNNKTASNLPEKQKPVQNENQENGFKKCRFLSYDTKKFITLIESSNKVQENTQFYFNASYIQKKGWFAYPKTSILKKNNNNSFIQKNCSSPSTITHSIASSPKKNNVLRYSFNKKLKDSLLKPTIKKKNSKEGRISTAGIKDEGKIKISRLFEKNFIENLNNMVSNPEIPLPPLNLAIKQTNLKHEG